MTVQHSRAIIDIGSNSVRLVVYAGAKRAPLMTFNEKIMAGLGEDLPHTGRMGDKAMEKAETALLRYQILLKEMRVRHVRVVATAAVRDAENGAAFVARMARHGLKIELLSGAQEARAAGYGVISAFPDAHGIVGDLGGGSLELIRMSAGQIMAQVSLPLGVLRLARWRGLGDAAFSAALKDMLTEQGWDMEAQGLPFYMVGGSWRALARYHMHLQQYPLPVLHHYALDPQECAVLAQSFAHNGLASAMRVKTLSQARVASLDDANYLLRHIATLLQPSRLVVSAYGLREGLLYEDLRPPEKAQDPLLEAAREAALHQCRFAGLSESLYDWMRPLFAQENAQDARLRRVACTLNDIAWNAHPDFRAEHGFDFVLHSNWVGLNAAERIMLCHALFTCFGGTSMRTSALMRLATPAQLEQATAWGLAMRFGQRLCGGVPAVLKRTQLETTDTGLVFHCAPADSALYGEAVKRRHKALAVRLGLKAKLHIEASPRFAGLFTRGA